VTPGPFRVDADPDALDAAATRANALAEDFSRIGQSITGVPGGLTAQDWSGQARDAVTTEMEGLGRAVGSAADHFRTAGRALTGLAREVRDAVEIDVPSLNSRWIAAEEHHDTALRLARAAYQQKATGLPKGLAATDRQDALTGPARTRDTAGEHATQALDAEQARLQTEYDTLIETMEQAFTRAGHIIQAATLTPANTRIIDQFTASGGTGALSAWCSLDGGIFPPGDLGTLDALKGDLGLLWYRRGEEQAALATDLARGITRGDDPRLTQVRDLLGEYADNPAFATTFLTGLGAGGLLHLTTITTQGDGNGVAGLQQDLGRILARGTRNPGDQWQVSTEWVKDLTAQGRQHWAYHPDPTVEQWTAHGRPALENFDYQVYGYQALGVLLRTGSYSAGFLNTVGGDLLAADRAGNGIDTWPHHAWDHTGDALAPGGDADTWDPLVGLLAALGHDPHTAQEFFTGETTGAKGTVSERFPRVDYLVTDRNWGSDDTGINALGHALRTATATTEPAALRIVESIVHEVAADEGASKDTFKNSQIIHPALRPHLGHVYAHHIYSVINAVGEGAVDSQDYPLPIAELDAHEITGLIAELGKDPAARATLLDAAHNRSLELYESAYKNNKGSELITALRSYSYSSAYIIGALDHGATTEEGKRLTEQDKAHNGTIDMISDWATVFLNTGVAAGNLSGPLPGAAAEAGKAAGTTFLDGLAEKYRQDRSALAEHLAKQRTATSSDAATAVLQSLFLHHTPTTELVDAGIIDTKTGRIRSQSDWSHGAMEAWKKSFKKLPDGGELWGLLTPIHSYYNTGRSTLWLDERNQEK
jgi:uncharacterized protein YukE